jgi:hypothetical protein
MLSGRLPIGFQATKDTLTIVVGEEFGIVWKIMDEPVAGYADEYGGETFLYRWSVNTYGHADGVRGTKMKIHAQPGLPPIPSIFAIAAASKPPKLPASAAAEKKIADRMPNSLRLYQHER